MVLRLSLGCGLLAAATMSATSAPEAADLLPSGLPGRNLPVAREFRYRMRGRVRVVPPFWVARDNVGAGVIRWRTDGHREAYEILIGSDPARAPRHLNRWGYLAEEVWQNESSVVGLIARSGEDDLDEVGTDSGPGEEARAFSSIRARVTDRSAHSVYSVLYVPSALTYRDARQVLGLALEAGRAAPPRTLARPAGTRPGFLTAVAELMRGGVEAVARGAPPPTLEIPYVYGDDVYQLGQVDARHLAHFEHRGRRFDHVIRGRFETRRQHSRKRTKFELVYGTGGDFAGVPVLITYRPRWWLEVELLIESWMPNHSADGNRSSR